MFDTGRTLHEDYLVAGNASDLSPGPATDALAAVAWNRSRIGAALLRLHSQWDGAAKRGLKLEQAFQQLKALPEVRHQMLQWAHGRPEPVDLVVEVLAWWLDGTCKPCTGTRYVTEPGRPKRPCPSCGGRGQAATPRGEDGRAMLAHMEGCMHRARASIKARR